jgi:DNA-directed RNA polymerase subunit RPC12/RpoP
MADIKFSCAHCGQHISCDEAWAGHEIQCPACQNKLIVPPAQPPASAPAPAINPPVSQPPSSSRPKLSAGATQVARSTVPGPSPRRQSVPRPPKTGNPILKFAVIAVVLAVVGGAGYRYLPGLLSQVQEMGTSKTAAPANAGGGGRGGPLGEVDGAMDVSDALDGGSSPRPPPAASRKPVKGQRPAPAATNSAAK